ncbi:zf-HC2 domain-containing protein [Seminibacterium arietis]|uniref:Zf-HC2 domain-containing protein n=1 Tax=Seminibacterium arietis TaxID=1173502 RepID=A0ABW3I9P4_9PAST
MLKCNRITRLVSQQQEQSLPFSQLIQVKMHLAICSRCRAFDKNNQKLTALMKKFSEK